jgi:hypothetical protein
MSSGGWWWNSARLVRYHDAIVTSWEEDYGVATLTCLHDRYGSRNPYALVSITLIVTLHQIAERLPFRSTLRRQRNRIMLALKLTFTLCLKATKDSTNTLQDFEMQDTLIWE